LKRSGSFKWMLLIPGFFAAAFMPVTHAAEQRFSRMIVIFNDDVAWVAVRKYAADWETRGVTVAMDLPVINGLALRVPLDVTGAELADDPRVARVKGNQIIELKNGSTGLKESFIKKSNKEREEYMPWGYFTCHGKPSSDMIGAFVGDDIRTSYWGIMGRFKQGDILEEIKLALKRVKERKIRIAVLDTGIFGDRNSIKYVLKGGDDVISGIDSRLTKKKKARKEIPEDDNVHGTFESGIITSVMDSAVVWGEKARIEFYSFKVLDHNTTGDLYNVIMGLQWAVDNDMDIINMSFDYRTDSPVFRRAIHEVYKAGITIIVGSDNHSSRDDGVILEGLIDGGGTYGG
jgi:hypothetical protein